MSKQSKTKEIKYPEYFEIIHFKSENSELFDNQIS